MLAGDGLPLGVAARIAAVALALGIAASGGPAVAGPVADPDASASGKRSRVIASDTAASADPVPFWGEIECENDSRHEWIESGGDPHLTATGASQGNDAFRRLHVVDGDDFFGERCELGNNNRGAPTAFYREGRRRITKFSLRLPPGFPVDVFTWQVVMQMKQAGPAANSTGTPVIELGAYDGHWRLSQSASPGLTSSGRKLWTAPASLGVWTRFSFDVRYSRHRRKGYIKVKADLNGDGDYKDAGEKVPRIRTYTLKVEIPGGGADGIPAGRSIPSHLRAGIYHDPAVQCDAPDGCYIDLDNVQVVRPPKR
jgi:Polysaccharide lyase